MNENKIRFYYPLVQFVSILFLALLIIPISLVTEFNINDQETLFSINVDFFKYGIDFSVIMLIALVLNLIFLIVMIYYFIKIKKQHKHLNLLNNIFPEINDNDEGLSFVTYQSLKAVYSFIGLALPIMVGIILFLPDNFVTKSLFLTLLMFIAAASYFIYFLKTRQLLK
ncbi:hypothetical protein [Macrococcus equipercicus]|uniref:Uncharacterized protein n=1 Tax=Macrococcus equipercicus TaxID=69967 RepID=A0A9Q9BQM9_9STAP|nr:hypothetical protein [Macrococcus equipercicus]UTH13891.1 hypothetical protein KFV11_00510 [Macrococcus equipercicus]